MSAINNINSIFLLWISKEVIPGDNPVISGKCSNADPNPGEIITNKP